MMNVKKYQKQYYMPPVPCMDWAEKDSIDKAPVWCSVDLRDGNQALVIPMSLEQKVRSVLSYAREHRHFKFSDVLERESDRLEIVVAFLAVLELSKAHKLAIVEQEEGYLLTLAGE